MIEIYVAAEKPEGVAEVLRFGFGEDEDVDRAQGGDVQGEVND